MKIILDNQTKIDSIVLENYSFAPESKTQIHSFCQEAFSTPETIGGIYWQDMKGINHTMETTNQTLYCLLFTFYYLSRHQSVNIAYDTDAISDSMLESLFKRPNWFIRLCQKFGVIKQRITYTDFIRHIREQSTQTETVSGEVLQ